MFLFLLVGWFGEEAVQAVNVVLQRLPDEGIRPDQFQSGLGCRHDFVGFPDNLDRKSEIVWFPGQRLKLGETFPVEIGACVTRT
jgi:hypothetical protein